MRLRSFVAAGLLASLLFSRGAAADDVSATRYELAEREHAIDLRIDRGTATLVVRRAVMNHGPKSDQATFLLDVPGSAVATRLRTAAVDSEGRTTWFEGELMEAEAAARKYQELTGIGGYYPKDPALLSWRHQGLLALQVFPVPAHGTKVVEYTLKMPASYAGGVYKIELPALGTEARNAAVRVSATHPEDAVTVNGVAPAAGTTVLADRTLTIELRPRGVTRTTGTVASVAIGERRHLVRARIAAPPRLGEAPQRAHVVVLFDNSRSMTSPEAALAAVRAYLASMPQATVDFLTFDRRVDAPIGRALPVETALAKLTSFTPSPANGSRVDDALARADAILQTSRAEARRVVLVTDTLTRSSLTPEKIAASPWKSGALLHVATVTAGDAGVVRDDDSPWAVLPRRTGGLFWTATAPDRVDAAARVAFEEWARPKRIDRLAVVGLPAGFEAPSVLDEGEAIEHFEVADGAAPRVTLTGETWSKPFSASFVPSDADNKLAAALVFGDSLHESLSEPEMMKLALLGGAVSPVTSYLAIEPGVRPSNEGLDWTHGEGLGFGSTMGFGSGSGRAVSVRGGSMFDDAGWLRGHLLAAARACGVSAGGITAKVETTRAEIVEVTGVATAPTRDARAEHCVEEGLWNVTLPADFEDSFASFELEAAL